MAVGMSTSLGIWDSSFQSWGIFASFWVEIAIGKKRR